MLNEQRKYLELEKVLKVVLIDSETENRLAADRGETGAGLGEKGEGLRKIENSWTQTTV